MSLFHTEFDTDRSTCTKWLNGVIIKRRGFLRASLGAVASGAVTLYLPASAREGHELPSSLSWDDLVERAMPIAELLIQASSPNEDAYLTKLGGLIAQRRTTPRSFFDLSQPVATHKLLRTFPLTIVHFRLAPGAVIPHHDHRDHNGVLTVTEGTLRVRSFQKFGSDRKPASENAFKIVETNNTLLENGGQITLSRTRDNIHELTAGPEGARFIDFFTLFHQNAHSAYLNVSDNPSDPAKRIYDATWA